MKMLIFLFAIGTGLSACNAQSETNHKQPEGKQQNNQPEVHWKVHKERDKNGNIIRYDSTYTWSYSSMGGDTVSVNVDSVMHSFKEFFDERFPALWGSHIEHPFMNDSMLYRDFFKEDYFFNRWENDFFRMDDLFKQMDSLREEFFREAYPGLNDKGTVWW